MKFPKLYSILLAALLFTMPLQSKAAITGLSNPEFLFTAPNTLADFTGAYCDNLNYVANADTNTVYMLSNCGGTPVYTQIFPPLASNVSGLSALLAGYFPNPTGTSSQYLRGDGSAATFPTIPTQTSQLTNNSGFVAGSGTTSQYIRGDGSATTFPTIPSQTSQLTNNSGFITTSALSSYLTSSVAAAAYFPIPAGTTSQYLDGTGTPKNFSTGSRTFNYPSRTLASCFQVSASQDADVNYSVDISAGIITLGGGTASLTSYTNSGCSTGAQTLFNGAVSSVALSGTSSIPLHAVAKAGTWLKVAGTGTGGGTAAIDGAQAETLLP